MSEAPVVELVDVVAAVQVAMVSTPRQPGLGPSPMVLAPPRVLKVTFRPTRGLHPPALGLFSVWERCLALDPVPLSTGLPSGGPPVESHLALPAVEFGLNRSSVASHSARPARVSFCSFSLSWAFVAWGLS